MASFSVLTPSITSRSLFTNGNQVHESSQISEMASLKSSGIPDLLNEIESEGKKLQDEYTRLFSEKNNMSKSVHLGISYKEINEVIDCIANSKSSGFGGVSNEILKYSGSNFVTKIVKTLFEKMVNYQTMPYYFNVSILKTILNDKKKPNDDISNLKPVAISDAYANIFETIILKKLERQHADGVRQEGAILPKLFAIYLEELITLIVTLV
ncbi:unnamed protein product [Brachionus calyciflorus]|uniref:Uncharacterized protein n=1 Tax=Brachionus calyciflorus TaxID=104777 RepID=A0A814AKE8_9BILA|nr:unnamed protein product [Brachionus calyciflorus]